MSNGGLIGKVNAPSTTSTVGVWNLREQHLAKTIDTWPIITTVANPLWSNVVALFKFDNNLTDSKGNVTLTTAGSTAVSSTQSKFGGYSLYVGDTQTNGNYAAVGGTTTGFQSGTGDFTIEMWIYPARVAGGNLELFQWNTSMIFGTSQDGGSNIKLFLFNGSAYNHTVNITANAWHHVGVMRKAGKTSWLQDGNITQFIASDTVNISSLSSPRIGASTYANESWRGYIDNFRYANEAFYSGSTYIVPDDFPTS